jgi:hypothetical protein
MISETERSSSCLALTGARGKLIKRSSHAIGTSPTFSGSALGLMLENITPMKILITGSILSVVLLGFLSSSHNGNTKMAMHRALPSVDGQDQADEYPFTAPEEGGEFYQDYATPSANELEQYMNTFTESPVEGETSQELELRQQQARELKKEADTLRNNITESDNIYFTVWCPEARTKLLAIEDDETLLAEWARCRSAMINLHTMFGDPCTHPELSGATALHPNTLVKAATTGLAASLLWPFCRRGRRENRLENKRLMHLQNVLEAKAQTLLPYPKNLKRRRAESLAQAATETVSPSQPTQTR